MAQTGPPPPPSSNIYLGNGAYSDSQGTICTPANGVNGGAPAVAPSYACTVATPNGGYAVINVGANQDNGGPDFAALADAATKIGANSLMRGGPRKPARKPLPWDSMPPQQAPMQSLWDPCPTQWGSALQLSVSMPRLLKK